MKPSAEKIEFDTTKIIIDTYNKIAMWNNSDFDSKKHQGDALKIVSQDIVQSILDSLADIIGVQGNTEIYRGKERVGEFNIKDSESFSSVDEKGIFEKLFEDVPDTDQQDGSA